MKSINVPVSRHTLSHNLLNNLTGIVSNLRLLKEEGLPLTSHQKSCFEDAAFSGEELLKFAQCLIEQSQTVDMLTCPYDLTEAKWLSALLIESASTKQKASGDALKSINCHVDIVSNGYEALQILNKAHDIVLLNTNIPGMDGCEIASKIRQQLKMNIPIVGITADLTSNRREQFLLTGFNEIINESLLLNGNALNSLLKSLTNKTI